MSNNLPFQLTTEKATSELNTTDDWQLIMEICDRIPRTPSGFVDNSSFQEVETVSQTGRAIHIDKNIRVSVIHLMLARTCKLDLSF